MPRVGGDAGRAGARHGMPVCFKASFDKANRSRARCRRAGPGSRRGCAPWSGCGPRRGLPILTDIHEAAQAAAWSPRWWTCSRSRPFSAARPTCWSAAGAPGSRSTSRKGSGCSAEAMAGRGRKGPGAAARADVAVTERGTFFGYGDLVVDMRNFAAAAAAATGAPVHLRRHPFGAAAGAGRRRRQRRPPRASSRRCSRRPRSAGADGFFLETHPDPGPGAASDAATQWPLDAAGRADGPDARALGARRGMARRVLDPRPLGPRRGAAARPSTSTAS